MKRRVFATRKLLLVCLLAAPAFAQNGSLGAFTNSGDVGGPSRKGSTQFDAATGEYRVTGSGANCAHNADRSDTVVFSDVSVESTVPPGSH